MCHYLTLISKSARCAAQNCSADSFWITHKTFSCKQTTVKELLFDCGTNLTLKHAAQQPGRQGVDPDQGFPFNLLRRQWRLGTKTSIWSSRSLESCKVGRVPIMRPAASLSQRFVLYVGKYMWVFFSWFVARKPGMSVCHFGLRLMYVKKIKKINKSGGQQCFSFC